MIEYELPKSCPQGYTKDDLEFIFNPYELRDFHDWMFGQTQSICDGKTGKHHGRWGGTGPSEYIQFEDNCECHPGEPYWFERFASPCVGKPHGVVTYSYDVERYIEGGLRKAIWD